MRTAEERMSKNIRGVYIGYEYILYSIFVIYSIFQRISKNEKQRSVAVCISTQVRPKAIFTILMEIRTPGAEHSLSRRADLQVTRRRRGIEKQNAPMYKYLIYI